MANVSKENDIRPRPFRRTSGPGWMTVGLSVAIALLSGGAPLLASPGHPGHFQAPSQLSPTRPSDAPGARDAGLAVTSSPSSAVRPSVLPAASASYLVLRGIPTQTGPIAEAYDSAKGEMFIGNSQSYNVSVYSNAAGHIVANISVGAGPTRLAYDSGKGEMFVSVDKNVSVISDSTNTVAATVHVGGGPLGIAYDSAKGEVFVANYNKNLVNVISDATNTIVANISVLNATGVVYDSGLSEIFVAGIIRMPASGFVDVISDSTNRVVATVPVGLEPFDLAYDPSNGEVYTTNAGTANVSVISDATNRVAATVNVGGAPTGVAYDPHTGDVLVVNGLSDNMSVISTATNRFIQSVGNYVGSYGYGAAYDPGIQAIFVADNGLNVVALVVSGWDVTFTESGLPTGTQWIVNFTGTNAYGTVTASYVSVGSSLLARFPNGSYRFSIVPVRGFLDNPAVGSFTVAGNAVSQAILFRELFVVTFSESGLTAGTSWSVTFNGTLNGSTTNAVGFLQPNGTYLYALGSVNGFHGTPASGSVTVAGTRSVSIVFEATYAVGFTETGLPSGTNWSVTLAGVASSSLTSSIPFAEVNGTYPYTLAPVAGWTTSTYNGAVTVAGSPVTKVVSWQPATFTVTFAETGLPIGTSWSVTLNSVTVSGVGDLAFPGEANGTYSYTVGGITGYSPTPSAGSIRVTGPSAPVAIVFHASSSPGSTFLGLPAVEGYGVVAGALVAVVIAGVALASRRKGPKAPPATPPSAGESGPGGSPPPP